MDMRTLDKETQQNMTPTQAFELLKSGNYRFVNNLKINRNLLQQVNETSDGQHPFAVILSCIDSRTSAELIFDQGLGDVFSVRIAGNILNEDILGSMEFACAVAGAKIVVVLGHTKCGAVGGACKGVKLGNLTGLLNKLQPAVEIAVADKSITYAHDTYEFADVVAEHNVHLTIERILNESPILNELVEEGKIGIAGAMYDVESGAVEFYPQDVHVAERVVVAKAV